LVVGVVIRFSGLAIQECRLPQVAGAGVDLMIARRFFMPIGWLDRRTRKRWDGPLLT